MYSNYTPSFNFKMTPMYLLLSLCLLSGLSDGQTEAISEVDLPRENQETSLDEDRELNGSTINASPCSQDCCSSLYQIGQHVGALAETQKSTISKLEETTRRQEETITRLEKTIQTLEETIRRQEASDAQLAALNNTLSTVINKERIKVAFSASFPLDGTQTAGSANVPIVYKHVVTNLGNAYSPVTGFFTAPVRGVYSFSFTSFYWGSSGTSGGALYHNKNKVVSWYRNNNANHATSGSNSAVLILNAGDKVAVYLWAGRIIADNGHKYSSFSGFLLYAL